MSGAIRGIYPGLYNVRVRLLMLSKGLAPRGELHRVRVMDRVRVRIRVGVRVRFTCGESGRSSGRYKQGLRAYPGGLPWGAALGGLP